MSIYNAAGRMFEVWVVTRPADPKYPDETALVRVELQPGMTYNPDHENAEAIMLPVKPGMLISVTEDKTNGEEGEQDPADEVRPRNG